VRQFGTWQKQQKREVASSQQLQLQNSVARSITTSASPVANLLQNKIYSIPS